MPLTTKTIENAKYGDMNAEGKLRLKLSDSGGLYIELAPSGGKWWRWKYRFAGKESRISFGTFPDVSLKEARERRAEARKLLAKGINPSKHRREEKRRAVQAAANSFEAVAREWYDKRAHIWTPTHASDVLRRMESGLFPDLGARPLPEITAPELLAAVRKIEHRGAHDLAHRVLQVASQVFRYGVASGRCERDPAPDLRGALTPHKPRNQHAVSADELPALLRAIDGYTNIGDKQTALALRLLALTFVRTNELIGAEWCEIVDLDGPEPRWEIPAARMKKERAHIVPLAGQVVAILRELRALSGGSRYVLPGRNPDKPISNNTLLFALYRLGYKGRMTGHGFRSVASTMLNERGFHADVVERQLAHVEDNKVRGAYNRAEYLPERREMMQQWADMLDAMLRGADVVPIKRRRRAA